jgi:hypothetical protein
MSKPSKEKSEVNEEKLPTATPPLITTTPNPSPTKQIPLNTDKTDWQTYINNKLGFSIKHPKIIKPEEMDNQSVVFQFWGPTQSNDTEFYDGINIAFEKRTTGGKTLAAVVDEYYKGSKEIWGDKEVGEISSTTFGGFSGYTYKVPEHEYFYLGIDGQNYLEILNLSGDPGNLGYIKISQEMLKTFRKI